MVDESPAIDEIPAVNKSWTVDESQLTTTDSTQEAVKTHLNVGEQAAGVMNEKSCHCIVLFIYSHQMDTWIELYFITMNA